MDKPWSKYWHSSLLYSQYHSEQWLAMGTSKMFTKSMSDEFGNYFSRQYFPEMHLTLPNVNKPAIANGFKDD